MHEILAEILAEGRADGATDVHIGSDRRVVYRHGRNIARTERYLTEAQMVDIVGSLTERNRGGDEAAQGLLARTGAATVTLGATSAGNIRVKIYHADGMVVLSIRFLEMNVPDARELGIPDSIINLADAEGGLVLFSGPQKNSKTTSTNAIIAEMNANTALPRKIAIIDDTIEYRHTPDACIIDHITLGPGRDSPNRMTAVRTILQADTQVVSLGEFLSSLDEATAVLNAAEAGLYVLANTHAPDPARAIERLLDPFPPDELRSRRAVVAQRLLASIGVRLLPTLDGGTVVVFSVLWGTPAVASAIKEGDIDGLQQNLSLAPNIDFETALRDVRGRVSPAEIERVLRGISPVGEEALLR